MIKIKGGKDFLNKLQGLPSEENKAVLAFCEQKLAAFTHDIRGDLELPKRVLLGLVEELLEEKTTKKLLKKMHAGHPMLLEHSLHAAWWMLHLIQAYASHTGEGKDADYLKMCVFAALLHDVGLMEYPDEVIYSSQEFDLENHVLFSSKFLEFARLPDETKFIVRQHHELMTGKGYPAKLNAETIFFPARFLTIVDSYVALTTSRAEEQALSPREAVMSMLKQASKYDTSILPIFKTLIHRFYSTEETEVDSAPQDLEKAS